MFNLVSPPILPQIEPRFDEINMLRNMGCVAYYDLARDKGNKVFNLMNYNPPFTNVAPFDYRLSVDSNSDGVVDNFGKANYNDNTSTCVIDQGAQKITRTGGTTINRSVIQAISGYDIPVTAGEIMSFSVEAKVSGNVNARIYILWFNGVTFLSAGVSSSLSTTEFSTLKHENVTVPATATRAVMEYGLTPIGATDMGSVWVKNAKVVRGATLEPNSQDGIVTGAVQRPLGKLFDGVDDRIVTGARILDLTKGTISMIINSADTTDTRIFCSNVGYFELRQIAGEFKSYFYDTGNRSPSGYTYQANKWYMITGVWNSSTIKFYVNGNFIAQANAATMNPISLSKYFTIGTTTTTTIKGLASKFLYSTNELNANQLKQLFKQYAPIYKIPS